MFTQNHGATGKKLVLHNIVEFMPRSKTVHSVINHTRLLVAVLNRLHFWKILALALLSILAFVLGDVNFLILPLLYTHQLK